MKAITQRTYGPPKALTVTELPEPVVGPGDVLITVHATPVTQGDRRLRAGDFPGFLWLFGRLMIGLTGPRARVPGSMFAGRVVAVGARVTRFRPGDDVFGASMAGAMAERLVLPETAAIATMPPGLSHAQAAALPYGAGTAAHFLDEVLAVQPGERVAIIGAAGGVGRYAVQLAKHRGAHVVAVGRPTQAAALQALGADEVTTLDRLRHGPPCDVVLDTPGALTPGTARALLTPAGRYATLIVTLSVLLAALLRPLRGGPRFLTGVAMDDAAGMTRVGDLAAAGAIRPPALRRFDLGAAVAAHEAVEAGAGDAVVVVQPVPPPLALVSAASA